MGVCVCVSVHTLGLLSLTFRRWFTNSCYPAVRLIPNRLRTVTPPPPRFTVVAMHRDTIRSPFLCVCVWGGKYLKFGLIRADSTVLVLFPFLISGFYFHSSSLTQGPDSPLNSWCRDAIATQTLVALVGSAVDSSDSDQHGLPFLGRSPSQTLSPQCWGGYLEGTTAF